MFCLLVCVQRYEFASFGQNQHPQHVWVRESDTTGRMRHFIEFETSKTGKISKSEAVIWGNYRSLRPENWRFIEV